MKTRKITLVLLLAAGIVCFLTSCKSSPVIDVIVVPKDAPKEVAEAVKKAPKGVLIGIGRTTGSGNANLSETMAETRARTQISRQLNTIVRDMVSMYQAGSSVDPSAALAFEDNITIALSSSTLSGSTVICKTVDDATGTYWAVVALTKAEAQKEIERAQNLAAQRLIAQSQSQSQSAGNNSQPAGNSNIDITLNFENAFNKAAAEGPQFNE